MAKKMNSKRIKKARIEKEKPLARARRAEKNKRKD